MSAVPVAPPALRLPTNPINFQTSGTNFFSSPITWCFVFIVLVLIVFSMYAYTSLSYAKPAPPPQPVVIPRPSVRVTANPQRVVLSKNPNAKTPGVTLTWTIRNGKLQSISPSTVVAKDATQVVVYPTQTTTYRVNVYNETLRETAHGDVTVFVERSTAA